MHWLHLHSSPFPDADVIAALQEAAVEIDREKALRTVAERRAVESEAASRAVTAAAREAGEVRAESPPLC